MVPAPVQAAAAAALGDEIHVDAQRQRYLDRMERLADVLRSSCGLEVSLPDGAFYLWVDAPDGDEWGLTTKLATIGGAIVSPGEFYGEAGTGHVRIAVVQPDDRIALVADRLAANWR